MTEKQYRNIFNPLSSRAPKREVSRVTYRFLSGLNEEKIGGNTSILQLDYDDGTALRAMIDPGDFFGDNKNLEHPSMKDCDIFIADMRKHFEHSSGEPATEPLDFIVLSHSHRDHIGALSKMILMGYKLPKIYATPYTMERLYQHLSNENIPPEEWPDVVQIAPGQSIKHDGLEMGFFSVSHSTPQSLGIAMKTTEGTIVHTCDWKMDSSVTWGPAFNEAQFKRVAGDDISLLLMDSTGADSTKTPVTEDDFRNTLRELFAKHKNKRFIIATHPGFEENMASVAKVIAEHNKTLYIDSWSHEQVFSALHNTGLQLSDHIDADVDIKSLTSAKNRKTLIRAKPKDAAVLVAGVLGQKNSSLVRAVYGQSKSLKLDPKRDIILMCGPNMPGQDKDNKFALLAEMKKRGFTVYGHPDQKLYPHAHARRKEIRALAKMADAKTIIPVHGDHHLRHENQKMLEKQGHNVLMAKNGHVIELKGGKARIVHEETFEPQFIGFETRSGSHWTDRDYVVKLSVKYNPPPTNDNEDQKRPPQQSERRKPRLFGDIRRY